MLARRARKLLGERRLSIRYAEYSRRISCWCAAELRQWVTNFICFCPAKAEVAGGGVVKSTRSGGKSQTSLVRRVIPRNFRLIGSGWPPASVSVPVIGLSFRRL